MVTRDRLLEEQGYILIFLLDQMVRMLLLVEVVFVDLLVNGKICSREERERKHIFCEFGSL